MCDGCRITSRSSTHDRFALRIGAVPAIAVRKLRRERPPVRHVKPDSQQVPLEDGVVVVDEVGARMKRGVVVAELDGARLEHYVEPPIPAHRKRIDQIQRLLLGSAERHAARNPSLLYAFAHVAR